jgi:hypothetical protein
LLPGGVGEFFDGTTRGGVCEGAGDAYGWWRGGPGSGRGDRGGNGRRKRREAGWGGGPKGCGVWAGFQAMHGYFEREFGFPVTKRPLPLRTDFQCESTCMNPRKAGGNDDSGKMCTRRANRHNHDLRSTPNRPALHDSSELRMCLPGIDYPSLATQSAPLHA